MRCSGRDAAVRFAFMMSLPITVGALVRPPSALRVGAATRLGTWFLSEHTNGVALGDVSGDLAAVVKQFAILVVEPVSPTDASATASTVVSSRTIAAMRVVSWRRVSITPPESPTDHLPLGGSCDSALGGSHRLGSGIVRSADPAAGKERHPPRRLVVAHYLGYESLLRVESEARSAPGLPRQHDANIRATAGVTSG